MDAVLSGNVASMSGGGGGGAIAVEDDEGHVFASSTCAWYRFSFEDFGLEGSDAVEDRGGKSARLERLPSRSFSSRFG